VHTLAAVTGGLLPREEAVPQVLELAVRHPRLLLLLACRTSTNPSDPPRAQHGRLATMATKCTTPPHGAASQFQDVQTAAA
jgi:hypothetical protein